MCAPKPPDDKPRRPRTGTPWLGSNDPRPPRTSGPTWRGRSMDPDGDERGIGGRGRLVTLVALTLVCAGNRGGRGYGGYPGGGYGGLWPRCVDVVTRAAARFGFGSGPFNLADHDTTCRYRRLMARLGVRAAA